MQLYHTGEGRFGHSNVKGEVFLPTDPQGWREILRQSIEDESGLQFAVSTSLGEQKMAAVIIGHSEDAKDPISALEQGSAFGFIAPLATLRQLRGAIDAAIAAVES